MERSGMELVRDIIETPIGTNGGQYIKIVYEIYIISTGREGKIMRLSINEILAKANMIENAEARIQFIKSNDSAALQTILKYCYDPNIKWMLPKGPAPYKKSDFVEAHGMLYSVVRKLYLFIEGGNPNLTKMKREQLFINLLESIDKDDAELLVSIKDKKMPYKLITRKFVEKVYPGLINE